MSWPTLDSKSDRLGHPLIQVAFAALIGCLGAYYSLLFDVAWGQHANDFGKFYYATRAWLAGGSLYEPTIATRMEVRGVWMQFLNMNPPHLHLVMLPFAVLPLRAANVSWIVANTLAGVWSARLTAGELRMRLGLAHALPLLFVVLSLTATAAIAITGQLTGLLMVPMTLAWRDARQGRWGSAGAWLGVVIAVKPFVGFLCLLLAWRGEFKAIAAAAGAAAASLVAGISMFGWQAHVEWLRALSSVSWAWSGMNGSLLGVLTRSLGPSPAFVPATLHAELINPLWAAGVVVLLALTLMTARRSVDHVFAAGLLAALLSSPLGWVYYLWLAMPPCVALWQPRVPSLAVLGLVLLSTPLFVPAMWGAEGLATLFAGSVYFWATLILWVSLVRHPAQGAHYISGRTSSASMPVGSV